MAKKLIFTIAILIASISTSFKAYSVSPSDELRLARRGAYVKSLPYAEQKQYFPGRYISELSHTWNIDYDGNPATLKYQAFGNEEGGIWTFSLVFNRNVYDTNSYGGMFLTLTPHDKFLIKERFVLDEVHGEQWAFKSYKSSNTNIIFFGDDGETFGFKFNSKIIKIKDSEIYNTIKNKVKLYLEAGFCTP